MGEVDTALMPLPAMILQGPLLCQVKFVKGYSDIMERQVIHITKQEAATRQLNQAIRLFFQRGDMLSVHTLAGASYQLLDDLGKQKGITSILRTKDMIRPERMKEWLSALSRTQNFLKHADRDPDQTHEYVEEGTIFLLFETVEIAARLLQMESRERLAFECWFFFNFPHLVQPLRARFWLAKDLADPAFQDALEPDAQELADIRNHLEHKYLKLHLEGSRARADDLFGDSLARSLNRSDFEDKALRLLILARAALMYLACTIHGEERAKSSGRPPDDTRVIPLYLTAFDDDWKT